MTVVARPSEPGRTRKIFDQLRHWRNRLLADPKFQAKAASLPIVRIVARRKAKAIFDLTAGFVYSQVLYTVVETRMLESLRGGPLALSDLAAAAGLPPDGADRLARAAVALRLLDRVNGDRYALGEYGAALLGNASVMAMIRHHAALYEDLLDPVSLLKQRRGDTRVAEFWSYGEASSGADPRRVAAYSDLMAQTQDLIAEIILEACSFAGAERLVDLGGGSGAFLCAARNVYPQLPMALCDLPAAAALARERFAREGVDIEAVGLDFLSPTCPPSADLITIIRVLHDHEDSEALSLLRNARRALAPGGRLIVAEPMSETRGAEEVGDAYFGLYLWAMGRGRPRTPLEIADLLEKAGFSMTRRIKSRNPMLLRIIEAR